MEMKEPERVVIAKPVASRPTCSNFRSFSELLAGAINASPPNLCTETAIAAIRPKTVRFKQMVQPTSSPLVSSQAELSRMAGFSSSDKIVASDNKPNIVYKPQAKLVSKRTVSLLANMANLNNDQQRALSSVNTLVQHSNQEKNDLISQITSNRQQNTPSFSEADQAAEASRLPSQNQEEDPKNSASAANCDRPSYDGYNWRKYGQKQVKGSEYPRSYYKCTHPNCPVKKKVERSFDGKIAEIVYKGEHNHSKPQPPKRNSAGTHGDRLVSDGTGQDANSQPWNNSLVERNEGSEVGAKNQNNVALPTYPTTFPSTATLTCDPAGTGSLSAGAGIYDKSYGQSGECDEGSKGLEGDVDEEPRSKRRKRENKTNEAGITGEATQGSHVVVQSSTDSEIIGDGFRWRKYGQKVVKGNSYPRSYYRCTSPKCNMRKYVERASDDPTSFITTYEGKHNHEMPLKNTNPSASEPDSQGRTSKDKP